MFIFFQPWHWSLNNIFKKYKDFQIKDTTFFLNEEF